MRTFAHLLSPGKIGNLELRNRIFMSPMGSNLADEDGMVGHRLRAYYTERAKGGAALITMGSVSIGYPDGSSNWRQEAISEERHIPGIRALAEDVHNTGAKLAVQLVHAGLVAMNDMLHSRPVWTPSIPKSTKEDGDMMEGFLSDELEIFSAPFQQMGPPQYKVMSSQDIEQLVQMFASAAGRAKRSGVDAVEIHGGHGYIISTFLSPAYNQRTDKYGGPIENRARLLVDIVKGVRSEVGSDFPVWARIDSQEYLMDDGITLEDAKVAAYLGQEAGLDAIHVSAHGHTGKGGTFTSGHATHTPSGFVKNAAAIRSVLKIPVITAGRIEPHLADRYIAEGKCDFIAMGRKLLADPHLPNKLSAGRAKDIRPCIYCYTCISQIFFNRSVVCAVNPVTGFEQTVSDITTSQKKRIVVVGGGPGGMETARYLSSRGHKVTLIEQSGRLGGAAKFASILYKPNQQLVSWLKSQIESSNVDVRLNTRGTSSLINSLKPDAVVVATGAVHASPNIPGVDRPNVFCGDDIFSLVSGQGLDRISDYKVGTATRIALKVGSITRLTSIPSFVRAVSRIWMPLGLRVVIIGGDLVGLELAEFLANRNREVTVIDSVSKMGGGLQVVRRWRVFMDLAALGVTLLPDSRDVVIGDGTVSYINLNGQTRSLHADSVIVAKGAEAELSLYENLKNSGFNTYSVGDCSGVGYLNKTFLEAAQAASNIEKS